MKLLYLLNERKVATVSSIAEMFGCNVRSVARYINSLRDAGFPIYHDKEVNDGRGSYKLREDFSLGVSGMTNEEALTFGIAKEMMAKFGKKTGKMMDSIGSKVQNIRSGLPPHIIISGNDMRPEVEGYLRVLSDAIVNLNRVKLTYVKTGQGGEKESVVVEPYYLFYRDGTWYLRAQHKKAHEQRLFTLSNIAKLEVLEEYFLPDPGISPNEVQDVFRLQGHGDEIEVVLRVRSEMKKELKRLKIHASQTMKELPDGRLEITLRTTGHKALSLWKYAFLERMSRDM